MPDRTARGGATRRPTRSSRRSRGPDPDTDGVRGSNLWVAGTVLLGLHLAAIPLILDREASQPFVLPKALTGQWLSAMLAATLAALVIRRPQAFRWSRLDAAVVSFVLAYALAAIFALDRTIAVFGAGDRMLGLISVLDVAILYFACVMLLRTSSDFRLLGVSVFAPGVLVAAYAFVQWTGNDWWRWSVNPAAWRTFATLGNSPALGTYGVTLALAALAIALLGRPPRLARYVLLVVAAALLTAAVTSGSRAPLIGLGAGGVLLFGIALKTAAVDRRLLIAVASALVLGIALALTFLPLGSRLASAASALTDPLAAGGDTQNLTLAARLVLYQVAAEELADRPLLGVGPDNYVVGFPTFRPENATRALEIAVAETSPHSWVAKLVADAGILGALTALWVVVEATPVIRRAPTALALIGLVALAGSVMGNLVTINDVSTDWLPWMALALIATQDPRRSVPRNRAPSEGRDRPLIRSRGWRRLALGALLLLPAVATISSLTQWEASRAAEGARRARARGDSGLALALASNAARTDPRRPEYWNGLGLSQVALSDTRAALRSFSTAVDLASYDVQYLANLVRAQLLLAQQGDAAMAAQALETARAAVQRDPNNPRSHTTLALVLLGHDNDAAANESRKALALSAQPDELAYDLGVRAYLGAGRTTEADLLARQGIERSEAVFGRTAVDLRLDLVRVALARKDRSTAEEQLQVILNIQPLNEVALRLRDQVDRMAP